MSRRRPRRAPPADPPPSSRKSPARRRRRAPLASGRRLRPQAVRLRAGSRTASGTAVDRRGAPTEYERGPRVRRPRALIISTATRQCSAHRGPVCAGMQRVKMLVAPAAICSDQSRQLEPSACWAPISGRASGLTRAGVHGFEFEARAIVLFIDDLSGRYGLDRSSKKAFELMGGGSRNRSDRVSVRLVVALAASVVAFGDLDGAQAFDFFGLWGSDEPRRPISRTAISYSVTIDVAGGDGGQKRGEGRFVALQAAQGRSSRRRSPRAARPERFRAGHRRALGRGLLQRHA